LRKKFRGKTRKRGGEEKKREGQSKSVRASARSLGFNPPGTDGPRNERSLGPLSNARAPQKGEGPGNEGRGRKGVADTEERRGLK